PLLLHDIRQQVQTLHMTLEPSVVFTCDDVYSVLRLSVRTPGLIDVGQNDRLHINRIGMAPVLDPSCNLDVQCSVLNSVPCFQFRYNIQQLSALHTFDLDFRHTVHKSVQVAVERKELTVIIPDDFINPVSEIKCAVLIHDSQFLIFLDFTIIKTNFHPSHPLYRFCAALQVIFRSSASVHPLSNLHFSDASYPQYP